MAHSLRARLERTRRNLQQAQRDAVRAAMLVARGLIAPQAAERARLKAAVEEHGLRDAEQLAEQRGHVADFSSRSPIAGRILTRTMELGEQVGEGTPLFTSSPNFPDGRL